MRKIIANFYLLAILLLAAQAISVIVSGNNTTINRLKYEQILKENQQLEEEIIYLNDKIAAKQALVSLEKEASNAGFVAIEQITKVKTHQLPDKPLLASLP